MSDVGLQAGEQLSAVLQLMRGRGGPTDSASSCGGAGWRHSITVDVHQAGDLPPFSMPKLGETAFRLLMIAWHRHHPLTRVLVPVAIVAYALVLVVHGVVESGYAPAA